jgi:hypothetical protein
MGHVDDFDFWTCGKRDSEQGWRGRSVCSWRDVEYSSHLGGQSDQAPTPRQGVTTSLGIVYSTDISVPTLRAHPGLSVLDYLVFPHLEIFPTPYIAILMLVKSFGEQCELFDAYGHGGGLQSLKDMSHLFPTGVDGATALVLGGRSTNAHGSVSTVHTLHLGESLLLVLLVGETNETVTARHAADGVGHDLGRLGGCVDGHPGDALSKRTHRIEDRGGRYLSLNRGSSENRVADN